MMTIQQAFDLALRHHQNGRLAEAEALYRQILAVQPAHADALHFLGVITHQQGHHTRAVELIRQSLALNPLNPGALTNLGEAHRALGQLDEAIAASWRALEIRPDLHLAHNNLGLALLHLGRTGEALAAFRRAIQLDPRYVKGHYNLGNALQDQRQYDEAVAAYQRTLELQPDYLPAHNNLGMALCAQGRLNDALTAYRRALALDPTDAEVQSNIIITLHFSPGDQTTAIAREQQRWNQCAVGRMRRFIRPHLNDRTPERRLRVGYLSPDFWKHPVGWNLRPLFQHHDHEQFEILCYSSVARPDEITAEFQTHAQHWRETTGVPNEALVEMIRQDSVDILVDLSQHTGGNRLPVFAGQAAPVQVSFAGYPESAGAEAIPYRISDRWLEGDQRMTNDECRRTKERIWLLDSFWCYAPCGMAVEVNELPAKQNGYRTLGCLNNFCKVNEPLLQLWARVLRKIAGSQFVMLAAPGSHRQWMLDIFEREGVPPNRVEFVAPRPRTEYLEYYHRLDMVLDTFPYNGHTTSLDALWMGVPVVSLAGERPVSRGGFSQLSNLGLSELVSFTEDDYVKIAMKLANDLPRLAELRRTLRTRMEAPVLMDAPRFARNIETAYRAMWRQWCTEAAAD